jgi:hypothetical protein
LFQDGIYKPLYDFLYASDESINYFTLSMKQLEIILGFPLPPSAYKYNAWWANDPGNHIQAYSWIHAGFKTSKVSPGYKITFIRNEITDKQ